MLPLVILAILLVAIPYSLGVRELFRFARIWLRGQHTDPRIGRLGVSKAVGSPRSFEHPLLGPITERDMRNLLQSYPLDRLSPSDNQGIRDSWQRLHDRGPDARNRGKG